MTRNDIQHTDRQATALPTRWFRFWRVPLRRGSLSERGSASARFRFGAWFRFRVVPIPAWFRFRRGQLADERAQFSELCLAVLPQLRSAQPQKIAQMPHQRLFQVRRYSVVIVMRAAEGFWNHLIRDA
jgi:hypothetical protein